MSSKNELVRKILDDCDNATRTIAEAEDDLQRQINALRNPTPLRDLTPAELNQIDDLEEKMDALVASDQQLTLVTLDALENSEGLTEMLNTLKEANKNLKQKTEEAGKLAEKLQQVANVIRIVDGIVQNLGKLAALT